jgi:DNA-3-methyladenine glycosylase
MNMLYQQILPRSFYSRHPVQVATDLLGKLLVRKVNDEAMMSGIITDTEAYGPPSEDPLVRSEGVRGLRHDWNPGLAWTTYIMRGRPTLNVTTMPPSCVLVRAIEPVHGFAFIGDVRHFRLTKGPINLANALSIDRALDKSDVTVSGPLFICEERSISSKEIVQCLRKNIRNNSAEPRRFHIKGNQFIS